jgi:hypothetical protein
MNKANEQYKMKVQNTKIEYLIFKNFFLLFKEDIIWKKYMPGWREVCDECFTTLFNYHYMCKQCGYMVCIECSNQFYQLTIEKRKSRNFKF